MTITDLFDIDFHIFTVIKFLFNLVVKFKYIYILLSVTPTRESTGANWLFSDKPNIPPRHSDTPTSSIDINHIAISHSHNGIIQNQNQSLSVPLAQQSVNGTQQALLRSPTQQSFIAEHRSVDLNAPIGTTDDTSLTLVSIPDADININDTDTNSGNI